jgi:hypothetical protein
VGIVTIVTLVALASGVEEELTRQISGLGLETIRVTPRTNESSTFVERITDVERTRPIRPADVAALQRLNGVASVQPALILPAFINLALRWQGHEERVRTQEALASPFFQAESRMLAGHPVARDEGGCVVPSGVLTKMGMTEPDQMARLVGHQVTLVVRLPRGESAEFEATVVGVAERTRPEISLGQAETMAIKSWWYGTPDVLETQGYDYVTVKAQSLGAVNPISDQIRDMGLRADSVQVIVDLANKTFAVLQVMLGSIGGLAVFVASLGVANTMLMATSERTREIGVLKALGASRGDILKLFVLEAGAIGLLGGLLGLGFGALLSRLIDGLAHRYLESQQVSFPAPLTVVHWWLAAGSLVFATLVGVAAGLYPALKAARLDPVTALRYE